MSPVLLWALESWAHLGLDLWTNWVGQSGQTLPTQPIPGCFSEGCSQFLCAVFEDNIWQFSTSHFPSLTLACFFTACQKMIPTLEKQFKIKS